MSRVFGSTCVQPDRIEHCGEIVIAVSTPAQHTKTEIDLGIDKFYHATNLHIFSVTADAPRR